MAPQTYCRYLKRISVCVEATHMVTRYPVTSLIMMHVMRVPWAVDGNVIF